MLTSDDSPVKYSVREIPSSQSGSEKRKTCVSYGPNVLARGLVLPILLKLSASSGRCPEFLSGSVSGEGQTLLVFGPLIALPVGLQRP